MKKELVKKLVKLCLEKDWLAFTETVEINKKEYDCEFSFRER